MAKNATKKATASVNTKNTKGGINMAKNTINGIDINVLVQLAKALEAINAAPVKATEEVAEPKKAAEKKAVAKLSVKDFEPKKDADGNYNWASWKACRRKYVEAKTGKILHGKDGQWLDGNEFTKAAAPFAKAFPYIKKAERKAS